MPTMAPQLRRVAFAARDLLVRAAAKEWNVAPEGLCRGGKVTNHRQRTFALRNMANWRAARLAQQIPDEDPVTPASQWTVAGKSLLKVDGREFVTGRHQYTSDLRPAGMLYGKVLRPPSLRATLVSCDLGAAQKLPGAVLVHDGDFVAAAAPSETEAEQAIAAIRAEWKESPQPSGSELFSYLKLNPEKDERGLVTQSVRWQMAWRAPRIAWKPPTLLLISRTRHWSRGRRGRMERRQALSLDRHAAALCRAR